MAKTRGGAVAMKAMKASAKGRPKAKPKASPKAQAKAVMKRPAASASTDGQSPTLKRPAKATSPEEEEADASSSDVEVSPSGSVNSSLEEQKEPDVDGGERVRPIVTGEEYKEEDGDGDGSSSTYTVHTHRSLVN